MKNEIVVYAIPPDSEMMMYAILFSAAVIFLTIFVIASIFDKVWIRVAGLTIMLIIFSWVLIGQINGAILTYNQTYKVYHTGGYRTVSGPIKDMKAAEDGAVTKFSVDKVQFVLSDDMAGFSQRDFRANQSSNSPDKLKNGDSVTIKYVHSKYEWSRAGNKYTILYIKKNGVAAKAESLPTKISSKIKAHSDGWAASVLKLWGICLIIGVGFSVARRIRKRRKAKEPENKRDSPGWVARIYHWVTETSANYDLKNLVDMPDTENNTAEPVTDPPSEKGPPLADDGNHTDHTTEDAPPKSDKENDKSYVEGLKGLRKSGLLTEEEYHDMIEKHKQ